MFKKYKDYIPLIVIAIIAIWFIIGQFTTNNMEVLKDVHSDVENSDNYYTKDELSSDLLGASRPSDYKTTLAESLSATASTTEDITVSSVTLVDGQTLTSADVGDYICLKINPNASTKEIVCCTGGISGTTFKSCSRGMSFKGDDAVYSGNEKSHSPGETVIISNDDTYLKEQYAGLDNDNTFYGTQTFASTTAISRINIGNGATTYDKRVYASNGDANKPFLQYDESENTWSFSNDGLSSTAIGNGASVYTSGNGIDITSSVITIATSSLSGLRFDNNGFLQIATSSGSGIYVDTDDTLKIATSSDFNFTGELRDNGVLGGFMPVGAVAMWVATTSPTGWLLCDGMPVSRATYSDLYAVIIDRYGDGDSSTTFNLPDLRQRVPLGYATSTDDGVGNMLGETGGATSTNQTIAQMAAHTHVSVVTNAQVGATGASGSNEIEGNTGSTGGGKDMSIMDPYITINYIIKY